MLELEAVHREGFLGAERTEMRSIVDKQVATIVELTPARKRLLLRNHFVYDVKLNSANRIKRFKARLVADGNRQTAETYTATFAAVPHMTSFRLFLTFVAIQDWEAWHLDVETAFLHAPVDTEIYISMPPSDHLKLPDDLRGKPVCLRLLKGLYGLKQAAYLFQQFMRDLLRGMGFTKLDSESCLWVLRATDGTILLLILLYVDDVFPAAPRTTDLERLLAEMQRRGVAISSLGNIAWALGMEVIRDSPCSGGCRSVDDVSPAL